MAMDFSGTAGAATNFDVIPKGQLAWANLQVRGVKGSGSGGAYLDCELTIDAGQPYAGRKVWEMIGDPNHAGNSEKYRQMGSIAITRILETGRQAGPSNPQGYIISDYSELSGLRVAIKVGIEPGENGHNDKNRVAEWLTPNPASQSGHKGFEKLLKGEISPTAAPTPPANAFGGGFGNQPQPQTTSFGGNTQPGFSQAPSSTGTAPSNPGATPNWLEQAGGAPQP